MRDISFRILAVALAAAFIAFACGSNNTKKPDAAVDALDSFCGQPGDMGNDIGVGHFCNGASDCSVTSGAHLCATIGNPGAHFCTKTCTMGGSATQCGAAGTATCECQSAGCGCTPNSCLGSGSAN